MVIVLDDTGGSWSNWRCLPAGLPVLVFFTDLARLGKGGQTGLGRQDDVESDIHGKRKLRQVANSSWRTHDWLALERRGGELLEEGAFDACEELLLLACERSQRIDESLFFFCTLLIDRLARGFNIVLKRFEEVAGPFNPLTVRRPVGVKMMRCGMPRLQQFPVTRKE